MPAEQHRPGAPPAERARRRRHVRRSRSRLTVARRAPPRSTRARTPRRTATIGEQITYTLTRGSRPGRRSTATPALTDTSAPPRRSCPARSPRPSTAWTSPATPRTRSERPERGHDHVPGPVREPAGEDGLLVAFKTQVDDGAPTCAAARSPTGEVHVHRRRRRRHLHEPVDSVTTRPRRAAPAGRQGRGRHRRPRRPGPGHHLHRDGEPGRPATSAPRMTRDGRHRPAGPERPPGSLGDGVWNGAPGVRTITWTSASLETGGTVARNYVARVDDPATRRDEFPNTVTVTGSSLDAAHQPGGERTAGSTSTPATPPPRTGRCRSRPRRSTSASRPRARPSATG